MSISAFVARIPAAEPLVGQLRSRFDATSKLGVPAHITVLFPFMAADEITSDILRQAQAALNEVPSFEFSLAGVGRFPLTAYLCPAPSEPFVALTAALTDRFPAFPPYGGAHEGVVPHLTVAHGDHSTAAAIAVDLENRLRVMGPVHTRCDAVTLLENSSGRWREMHVFALPDAREDPVRGNGGRSIE